MWARTSDEAMIALTARSLGAHRGCPAAAAELPAVPDPDQGPRQRRLVLDPSPPFTLCNHEKRSQCPSRESTRVQRSDGEAAQLRVHMALPVIVDARLSAPASHIEYRLCAMPARSARARRSPTHRHCRASSASPAARCDCARPRGGTGAISARSPIGCGRTVSSSPM